MFEILRCLSDHTFAFFIALISSAVVETATWQLQQNDNLGAAEPRYARPLQTMQFQTSWLRKKPTYLDLHYVNLQHEPGSSNLIGRILEVDVTS